MSGKATGRVWELDLPHEEIFVLLALADRGDHFGRDIYVGQSLVRWMTAYSEASVQRIVARLVAKGVLTLTDPQRKVCKANPYRINWDACPEKAPYKEADRGRPKQSPIKMRDDYQESPIKMRGDYEKSSITEGIIIPQNGDNHPSFGPKSSIRNVPTDRSERINGLRTVKNGARARDDLSLLKNIDEENRPDLSPGSADPPLLDGPDPDLFRAQLRVALDSVLNPASSAVYRPTCQAPGCRESVAAVPHIAKYCEEHGLKVSGYMQPDRRKL